MSSLSDIVHSAQDGRAVENLSQHFGLAPWQIETAVNALLPPLSVGLRKALADPATRRRAMVAVMDPLHRAAFESADVAFSEAAVEKGGELVEKLFGSPAAGQIAQLTGRVSAMRADILRRMTPLLASLAAGGLARALEKEGRAGDAERLAGEQEPMEAISPPKTTPPAGAAPALGSYLVAYVGRLFGGLFGGALRRPGGGAPASPKSGSDVDVLDFLEKTAAPGVPVSADVEAELADILR